MLPRNNQDKPPMDVAIDLGVVQPGLPPIESIASLAVRAKLGQIKKPPEVIHRLLHRGSKLLLGGTSKSNKSWSLIELAMCVAGGRPWWGFPTSKGRVLYINFELQDWSILERVAEMGVDLSVSGDLGEGVTESFDVWNLRGHAADIANLLPRLKEAASQQDYALIIIDPLFKLLGSRDENSAGDMADLFNLLEDLAREGNSAIAVAHHFAKGNAAGKAAQDRMSGSGVLARDPDAMVILTPHEEDDAFAVEFIVRHFVRPESFVLRWAFPRMRRDYSLDPEAIKGSVGAPKKLTEGAVLEIVGTGLVLRAALVKEAMSEHGVSHDTASRRVNGLLAAGKLIETSGFVKKP